MTEQPQHNDELQHTIHVDIGTKRDGYRETADMIVRDAAKTRYITELQGENDELKEDLSDARIDKLTMLPNRDAFDEDLDKVIERSRREKTTIGLAICDAAYLKLHNDYGGEGHQGGDKYLRAVADALRQNVRPTDMIYRIGGDEFAIIMPGIDASDNGPDPDITKNIANRTEQGVAETLHLDDGLTSKLPAHLNVGVAILDPAFSAEDLYATADAAMFQRKREYKDNLPEAAQELLAQLADDRLPGQ